MSLIAAICVVSCQSGSGFFGEETVDTLVAIKKDTVVQIVAAPDSIVTAVTSDKIDTKKIVPADLVAYAKQFIGVPYKYASSDPAQGFDCSGFITYVFNHFGIVVPRSSVDFTNVGTEVPKEKATAGDLILFTGTDSTIRIVGHMGIVTENSDSLRFIHSSSGKADGVTVTALNNYYLGRFVKVVRIFLPQS
jgi:cell wall-associated NlpC family hydrolase